MIAPTEYHPWTVMEYHSGSAKLYDFVYVTADTGQRNFRSSIEPFLRNIKQRRGVMGDTCWRRTSMIRSGKLSIVVPRS